jgi:hypothetical protein
MEEFDQNIGSYSAGSRARIEDIQDASRYQRVEAVMLDHANSDPVQVAVRPIQPIDWEALDIFDSPEKDFRPLLKLINKPGIGLRSSDTRLQNGALCLMAAVTRQAHNLIVSARYIDEEVLAAVAALHMLRQMLQESDWRKDSPHSARIVRFEHLLANMADRAYTKCRKMKPRPIDQAAARDADSLESEN